MLAWAALIIILLLAQGCGLSARIELKAPEIRNVVSMSTMTGTDPKNMGREVARFKATFSTQMIVAGDGGSRIEWTKQELQDVVKQHLKDLDNRAISDLEILIEATNFSMLILSAERVVATVTGTVIERE